MGFCNVLIYFSNLKLNSIKITDFHLFNIIIICFQLFNRCDWLKDTINMFKEQINPYLSIPKHLSIEMGQKEKIQEELIDDKLKQNNVEEKRKKAQEILKTLKIKYTPTITFGNLNQN